jgi:flagellar basal-body rod protein FlgC
MDLVKALNISASGLKAQGTRLRVIAENLANADSTAQRPGGEPYRRRVVTFGNVLDRELGVEKVRVEDIVPDRSMFRRRRTSTPCWRWPTCARRSAATRPT